MDTNKALGLALGTAIALKVADSKLLLRHDIKTIRRSKPMIAETEETMKNSLTVTDHWYRTLEKYAKKKAIIFEKKSYTFSDIEKASNRIANWAVAAGFKKGDCIALDMDNRPEFVISWLGLSKAGLVIALINHNIKHKALVHSIKIANSVGVLFGSEVAQEISDVVEDLTRHNIRSFVYHGTTSLVQNFVPDSRYTGSIDAQWSTLSDKPVDPSLRKGCGGIGLFGYIYTSGTTGLPKACVVSHAKYLSYALFLYYGGNLTPEDRIYITLPLYHSAGGGLGIGCMVKFGCTAVLARKFSAKRFFTECKENKVTVFQYIGELCRYLLATPPSPNDKTHSIRIGFGNGLRPEIWDEFQRRFNIPVIGEFYGATEGNGAFIHLCENFQAQGAVGRSGWLYQKITGFKIVKFDVENEIPIRGKDGFCIDCATGEPGELLFPIKNGYYPGYSDPESTKKKILHDVVVKGDMYYRTGDLLRKEADGYIYFVDRIGDTFRWQGENVSTLEVSEILCGEPTIQEANVYGVSIPGKDGRACMAAIVLREGKSLDMKSFSAYVTKELPKYSIPLFLRFLPEVEITGTFKHKKFELKTEGYNPSVVKDKMWYYNHSKQSYEVLDEKVYAEVTKVSAKL
eukprot:c17890_g1_i1.p1 GENE.c17890_g1_i1~~c17890_g1_i1.p1  ORF type:complete len:628 (-),score=255.17 c17890_g1_i1:76-1959(-)